MLKLYPSLKGGRFMLILITLCILQTPNGYILANSEGPNEMQHNAAFHRGLHCVLPGLNILKELKCILIWNF